MNKKLVHLFSYCMLFICHISFGQSVVNVNLLTGTANVTIPIYTVSIGQVSVPISISYSGSGIKPKDAEGTAGMGWQVNAGGQISRVVRGLPDDCTKDSLGNIMLGWMSASNTGASYASSYTIFNNGTCNNGASDITNINNNIPYTYDTEPDMFYVNAPGLSCQIVYDRVTAKFQPVNYQDLVIQYTTITAAGNHTGNITSFTITNDKGIKYVFAAPESVTQTTTATGTVNYFATKYKQYQHGITYFDAWNLVSITDANGNGVSLNYWPSPVRSSTDPVELFLGGSTTPSLQYKVLQTVNPQLLNNIGTNNVNSAIYAEYVGFNFTWYTPQINGYSTGQTYISDINGMGREFSFNYTPVTYNSPLNYSRAYLKSFWDHGCGTPISYQFGYLGVNTDNGTTALPDSTSNQLDYWGYYSSSASTTTLQPSVYVNPSTAGYPRYAISTSNSPGSAYAYSLSGSNRVVNATSIVDGSLNSITYGQGGNTTVTYEPNDYYDVPSSSVVQGGGIRVKQIVDDPGNGATNSIITRNYSYLNPSTGLSSGVPITLPQFAFTAPYSGTATGQSLWTNATTLSAYDLSTDDHTIMYAYAKVNQTGAGSTVYNYNVPATYWNTSAAPICTGCTTAEWYPTVNLAASYSCTVNNGPIANLTYSYPFIPNPNYNFERGLPISIISYNDAGTKVSETDYTYQRSYAPTAVTAFKAEDGPSGGVAKFYNKYTIFYNTSELMASVAKKVYDSPTLTQAQNSTVNYTYGSTQHKLLTKQTATNSDNSIVTTNISYTKDYTAAAGANPNVNAIYYMQQQNMNVPVETYQQVTKGATTVTTGASLTLFKGFTFSGTPTLYLPSQQLKMVQPNGAAFTPYTITGQTSTSDSKYFAVANFDQYDNAGYPETIDDVNKNIQTSFFDYLSNHVTAVFKNANYNEVAFNDFDSQFAPGVNTFTITGSSYTANGSHAGRSASITTTQTVTSSQITKNVNAINYIFSIWINAPVTGTLNLTGVSTNPTINYTAGGWSYYELKIPATALSSTFTLSFTSSQNITIDDILLYPDVAEASTATYDLTGHFKIAETNTNGVSAYFTNDSWGRLLFQYDQDRNIVLKKSYIQNLTPMIHYTPVSNINTNTSISFSPLANDDCTGGNTYTWSFGDGTQNMVTNSASVVSHTFQTPGTYSVNLSVNSAYFGTQTANPISVVVAPPQVNIVYNNTCPYAGPSTPLIGSVTFSKGGTVIYSFTNAQLIAGVAIIPDNYTIQINAVGKNYGAVTYTGASLQAQCFPSQGPGATYTVTDNLSFTPTIYLGIQPAACN